MDLKAINFTFISCENKTVIHKFKEVECGFRLGLFAVFRYPQDRLLCGHKYSVSTAGCASMNFSF